MANRFLLGLLFVFISFTSFSQAEEPKKDGPKRLQNLLIVNRQATQEETQSGKTIIATDFKTLMAHKYPDNGAAQKRLEVFQAQLKKLNEEKKLKLETTPFSVEYIKDEKETVYGDVVVITPAGFHLLPVEGVALKEPEEKTGPGIGKGISIGTLETLLTAKNLPPAQVAEGVITWTISASNDDLKCKENDTGFNFENEKLQKLFATAQLTNKKDLGNKPISDSLETISKKLNRQERFQLYLKLGIPCLNSIYSGVWVTLLKERREHLAWDFKHWFEAVYAKKDKVQFSGDIEGHVIDKAAAAEIEPMLAFLQEVLFQFKSGELAAILPRGFREWATWDTNTPDPSSRLEPNDFLTYYISHHAYKNLVTETNQDTVGRNASTRQAIQHVLVPERYQTKFFVQKSSEVKAKREGFTNYFIYCAGETIATNPDKKIPVQGDRLISYFGFTEPEIRDIRKANAAIPIRCGKSSATLTSPVERLPVPLQDPGNHRYTLGKDKKIKAVMTFELAQVVAKEMVDAMKKGVELIGYKAKEDLPVKELKKEFLEEMLDTDFYFPANHQPNAGTFALSVDKGVRVTLVKQNGGVTREVLVFLPPNEQTGVKPTQITDTDLGELFKKRRAAKDPKRLTIINMACQSTGSVTAWMGAYRKSLNENMTKEEVLAVSKDVPIAIGAGRSFASGSAQQYLSHARYPFGAIEIAAQEKTVKDLLEFLSKDTDSKNDGEKFMPVTNVGKNEMFDVKAQEDKLNIIIQMATGERLVY